MSYLKYFLLIIYEILPNPPRFDALSLSDLNEVEVEVEGGEGGFTGGQEDREAAGTLVPDPTSSTG